MNIKYQPKARHWWHDGCPRAPPGNPGEPQGETSAVHRGLCRGGQCAATHVRANRWLALDIGSFREARFNWVVFTFASAVLWAFVIGVMASEKKDVDGVKFNAALSEFAI